MRERKKEVNISRKRKDIGGASNGSLTRNLQEVSDSMGHSPRPGGSGYQGPLITDVARTIKAVQDANGSERALATWTRKFAKDGEVHAPMQGNKKK